MVSERFDGVLPLPAGAAVVFEALGIAAEEGARVDVAHAAHGVFEVWIDLYL